MCCICGGHHDSDRMAFLVMVSQAEPLYCKYHHVYACRHILCQIKMSFHRDMSISVVCNLLSCLLQTAQHSAPYTMARFIAVLYNLSFNFVRMFLFHITPVVSVHFDQAIFTYFSTPPLASNNEPRYLKVFTFFILFFN